MIIRHFVVVWRLLKDERVKLSTKVIFVLSVIVYTIAPLIPFMPLDDMLFFYIASLVFRYVANKQITVKTGRKYNGKKKDYTQTIDVEGKIIDDKK